MNTLKDLKNKFYNLDPFGKIIAITAVIFIIDLVLTSLLRFNATKYFMLPSGFTDFILQPWSLITYGFIHSDIWHVVFNMLFLYYLSRIASNLFKTKMILNVYFLGIIFGGLTYLAVANVSPASFFDIKNGVLVGASAGVSALLVFVALYMPNSEIRLFNVFNVKWKYIALFFIGFDVIRILMGINQGGYIAHLGGYLLGYLYATKLKEGKDIGLGFEHLMDTVATWFKPKSNLKTVHRKKRKGEFAGKTKQEFNTFNNQKKIDLILDKISKSGYESLTSEEKEFLFKAGKN
ncbi:rhomboid family intramembrane serine protease [uncultured Winogradskyella sp.]|uniref:rhomboid family intramembrane serine protease n=1 Tax=uncultured Winogradskyella sp. TaxID=395353 RepID=UPI0030DCC6C5